MRTLRGVAVLALGVLAVSYAGANPQNPNVVAGDADINVFGTQVMVETADGSIIEWDSFNVADGEAVQFNLDVDGGSVLNRVVGGQESSIDGYVGANGNLYLINPEGIVFGENATINVQSLVATSLDINNDEFGQPSITLSAQGNAVGDVVNHGLIQTSDGGFALLSGANVTNQGAIQAPDGHVFLIAANRIILVPSDQPSLSVDVTQAVGEAINDGVIFAPGGQVDINGALVKDCGCVEADNLIMTEFGDLQLVNGPAGSQQLRDITVTEAPQSQLTGPCQTSEVQVPNVVSAVDVGNAAGDGSMGAGSALGGGIGIAVADDDEPGDGGLVPDAPNYQPPCI